MAGAAEGLSPEAVTVVIAEAAPPPMASAARPWRWGPWLAGVAAATAAVLAALAWRERRRIGDESARPSQAS